MPPPDPGPAMPLRRRPRSRDCASRQGRRECVDLGAQLGDLAPVAGVGRFELLHAAQERLVASDLVGRCEKLRPDLVGEHKAGGQRDKRHERDAGEAAG
ncbi:MAG: hypothetical protein AUG05_05385 [Actinobacteria bacterium 13_1_20CM_2_66_18]|nr:MAG: hypothetical protein AUG05_05385 [Actinobacteria bacterium 13_1_20CM_2_66_18]